MRKRGFTLIELTVVISIIAILASILFPLFARARETARRSTCASNLQQIGGALNMYAQNYDGRYPAKNNEFGLLYSYASNQDIFYCPSDSAEHYWEMKSAPPSTQPSFVEPLIAVRTYSSYVYRGGLTNDDRADTPIASEAQIWHSDVANVLHLGGSVKGVHAEDYKPVVTPTQKPLRNPVPPPVSMPSPTPSSSGG